jgi:hypothetical protein
VTDREGIAWQRRAATLLERLLALGAKEGLPVISWTVTAAGSALHGEVLTHPHSARRADLAAWRGAITLASGAGPDNKEHTFASGETRLVANWRRVPVTLAPREGGRPGVHVTLTASVWPDEEENHDGS